MKQAGIYAIRHVASGKVYVGSSVNMTARWSEHRSKLRRGKHHSPRLQHAWDKYGEASFEFVVRELISDKDARIARETELIASLGACDKARGYNILPQAASPAGRVLSEETRRKISEAHKKIPKEKQLRNLGNIRHFAGKRHTAETRAKMSANNGQRGKTLSAERKRAIGDRHRGKTISDAQKAINAETCRRRNSTPEHRAKVSAALKGRVITPEWREKLRAAALARHANKTKEVCSV